MAASLTCRPRFAAQRGATLQPLSARRGRFGSIFPYGARPGRFPLLHATRPEDLFVLANDSLDLAVGTSDAWIRLPRPRGPAAVARRARRPHPAGAPPRSHLTAGRHRRGARDVMDGPRGAMRRGRLSASARAHHGAHAIAGRADQTAGPAPRPSHRRPPMRNAPAALRRPGRSYASCEDRGDLSTRRSFPWFRRDLRVEPFCARACARGVRLLLFREHASPRASHKPGGASSPGTHLRAAISS